MTASFLLRFQEACLPTDSQAVSSGTHTVTKIAAEQPDADLGDRHHEVLRHLPLQGCTPTKTAVQAEGPDDDPNNHATSVLPSQIPAMGPGTMTITAVHAETTDADLAQDNMHMIPRRS